MTSVMTLSSIASGVRGQTKIVCSSAAAWIFGRNLWFGFTVFALKRRKLHEIVFAIITIMFDLGVCRFRHSFSLVKNKDVESRSSLSETRVHIFRSIDPVFNTQNDP